jgi:hypothetical protein
MYGGTTHNETFDRLQEEYLRTRDNKTLGKMYEVCVEMSKNYINKYQSSRGLNLDVDELSHVAALFVIEQYLRKPDFLIRKLSGYMHFGCLKALFKDSKREQNEVSYDAEIESGKTR